jgi:hypothetical protein
MRRGDGAEGVFLAHPDHEGGDSVNIQLDISADDSSIHNGMLVPSLTAMASG